MHSFEFASPRTLDAAMSLLAEHGGDARLMAGGTDLIVAMRVGRRTPQVVIDVKQLAELNELTLDGSGLTIGAAVPCRRLWEDARIREAYPEVIDSAELIGGVAIQGRASFGGNLCNAAPSGDAIPMLIAAGAVAHVASPSGSRTLAVEEICTGPGQTSLADDEILVKLVLPAHEGKSGASFLRFIPRNEMDIAIASAAAAVQLDADGSTFVSARIAIGAVAPTPLYVPEAGAALAGQPVGEQAIEAAAQAASDAARPIDDMRGTVRQRKHLVKVLTGRALRKAIERAKGV